MRPNRIRTVRAKRRSARTVRRPEAFGHFALQPVGGAADTSPEPLLHAAPLPGASVRAVTPR